VRTKEIHPLTDDEIPKFLTVIQESPMCNAFAVCLFCGLREGELLGLSWDRINFEKQEIVISQQLQRSKEKGVGYLLMDTTKSGRPRTIKPPAVAFDYLRAERTAQKERQLRAGSAWDNPWNLVFTNELGTHYAIHTFYKEYKRMVEKIGRPDARPHDLRHTCATAAIASGSDIKSVQDLMGHATAAFTLDRYAHTSEKMKQDTADRLQAYYEALRAQ
jgi:integrase